MSWMEADYYSILELSPHASAAEIKKAFHRLAFLHHPDKNGNAPEATERFRKINEAYQTLSDSDKRYRYDQQRENIFSNFSKEIVPFIYAEINQTKVKRDEEIELTYAFGSEGRFFRKPEIPGCIITSGPIVNHRNNVHSGIAVRETLLSYTLCPLVTGNIIIPPASISYDRYKYSSNELQFFTEENHCYFKKNEISGNNPARVYLSYQQITSNTVYRKTIIHQRTVLIPRSDIAAWYHKVGGIMKVGLGICGTAWALVHGQSLILGFMFGSLLAGINVTIMYKIMGIKSLFYYTINHPLVKEYLDNGYAVGISPAKNIIGNRNWYILKSLFS